MFYFADICDLCTLEPVVILLVNTFYHSGDCISGYCWIFVYVILNAYLGLNHIGCGFGVSSVWHGGIGL